MTFSKGIRYQTFLCFYTFQSEARLEYDYHSNHCEMTSEGSDSSSVSSDDDDIVTVKRSSSGSDSDDNWNPNGDDSKSKLFNFTVNSGLYPIFCIIFCKINVCSQFTVFYPFCRAMKRKMFVYLVQCVLNEITMIRIM